VDLDPLASNAALRGLDGEEVEVLSLLRTIPNVGSEWTLQFSFMV
jgi:hypothetical protein